jgi:putative transposase
MSTLTRLHNSIAARQSQRNLGQHGIRAAEVHTHALERLADFPLNRPPEARFDERSILSVLLYAAATASSVEHAARALSDAPAPNTVRNAIAPLTVPQAETQLNEAGLTRPVRRLLKHPREVAIDLKQVPYDGKPQAGEEDFVWHLQAREGTTRFFVYATLYVIKKNQRFTLAVRACRRSEGLKGAVQWLVQRFFALGGQVCCLYLDRGFYSVEVLRYLQEEADVPFCMAAPQKGKKDGLAALVERAGVGQHAYTVHSPEHGSMAVTVAVVGKYLNGRWQKHGRARYAFVVHRYPFARSGLFEKYRRRFGIESSYRLNEKGRARTTAKRAALRLLLMGLAVLLQNLWVLPQWACVSVPRRGGRLVKHRWFTFVRMLSFLRHAIERVYQVVEEVIVS